MEFPFVASKGMKELPLEEITEEELLGQSGVKEWEANIERATESVDPEVRAASYRVGRIYPTRFDVGFLHFLTGMAWVL